MAGEYWMPRFRALSRGMTTNRVGFAHQARDYFGMV